MKKLKKMNKVSFDWDGTLSENDVQNLAAFLKYLNFDVHIVTSRYDEKTAAEKFGENRFSNQPIFDFAKELTIPLKNIIFTNMEDKAKFFKKNNDFIFHLDDDEIEVYMINQSTTVKGILKGNNETQFPPNWYDQIVDLITPLV